jgi:hypothetical protein
MIDTAAIAAVSDPQSPIGMLLTAHAVLQKHAPKDVGDWFSLALDAYVHGKGTIDKELGLVSDKKGCRAVTILRRALRDYWLRQACDLCPGSSVWARTCELHSRIKRFQGVEWDRLKHLELPPADASELRKALFWAFTYASTADEIPRVSIPQSKRQIFNILKSACNSNFKAQARA